MQIVTLTTDFGYRDHSLAALKGKLLSIDPSLNIIDITHGVTPYSIEEAAYIFKSSYHLFPENAIHVVSIFEYYSKVNELIFFSKEGFRFIGPNNGLFSLVFDPLPDLIYGKPVQPDKSYPIQSAISTVVRKMLEGEKMETIGERPNTITTKLNLKPVVGKHEIRGSIIYFDHYGNAVVNIDRSLFDKVRSNREFALYFKRFDPIYRVSEHYMDAEIGEPICKFNSQGLLEVAVTLGKAKDLLGLKKGDAIQIEFKR